MEKQSCNLTTKIVNFEVLQEFGASRKNCSDHCPLQIDITSKSQQEDNTIQEAKTQTIQQQEERMEKITNHPLMEEMRTLAANMLQREEVIIDTKPLSEEFQSMIEEDRFEEEAQEELECYLTKSKAFEDEPMPILMAMAGKENVKILIDSGAAISLITRKLADKLRQQGYKTKEAKGINIKVANGTRETIRETITIPIKLEDKWTNEITFFILQNLPFDILIGNPIL